MVRWCVCLCVVLLAGCPSPSTVDAGLDAGAVDAGPAWRVVLENQPGALLSAWQSADGVLYAVGGSARRALVLRHDDSGWWEMDPGTTKTLWWVFGFSADDVWAVGASGVVTHFDGVRWSVEREEGQATLFGVFGASPSALTAVGGVVAVSAPRPSVVQRTGSGWREVQLLPPQDPRAFFKAWGRGAETFFVGERGLVGRSVNGVFTLEDAGVTDRLTTVSGNERSTYIVGGLQRPVLLRREGEGWAPLPIPGTPQLLNGVAVSPTGDLVIVGLDGYVAEGREGALAQRPPVTSLGLHAAVWTPRGVVAVGGDLTDTLGRGLVMTNGALAGGAVRSWPHAGLPLDAGLDAGVADAGVPDVGLDAGVDGGVVDGGGAEDGGEADAGELDAGTLGPGEECAVTAATCRQGMLCWLVFGPFKSYCAKSCVDASECGEYGAGACCRLPGPQAMENVCLTPSVCDGGM